MNAVTWADQPNDVVESSAVNFKWSECSSAKNEGVEKYF